MKQPGDHLFYQNTRGQLLFRGDTRPPKHIFAEGFRRRSADYEGYLQKVDEILSVYVPYAYYQEETQIQALLAELKSRILGQKVQSNILATLDDVTKHRLATFLKEELLNEFYVLDNRDLSLPDDLNQILEIIKNRVTEPYYKGDVWAMDPSNSVSVTTKIDFTAMFPENDTDYTYIYFVRSETGFLAHERQKGHHYYSAQEIAIRDIPPGDVLGAVKVNRYFIASKNSYYEVASDIVWNPILENQDSKTLEYQRVQINSFVNARRDKFIKIPALGTPVMEGNLQFETVDVDEHLELQKYNTLQSLIWKLAFEKSNQTATAEELRTLVATLKDITATMPGRNKNVIDMLKNYKDYFRTDTEVQLFDSLVKDFENQASRRLTIK